jgi:WD repeat-containing protein 35
VKRLIAIKAAGENCVLAAASDDNPNQFVLILCNAIGTTSRPPLCFSRFAFPGKFPITYVMIAGAPVDSKYLEWQPSFVTMTEQHIIAANEDTMYVWQYRTSVSKLTSVRSLPSFTPLQH